MLNALLILGTVILSICLILQHVKKNSLLPIAFAAFGLVWTYNQVAVWNASDLPYVQVFGITIAQKSEYELKSIQDRKQMDALPHVGFGLTYDEIISIYTIPHKRIATSEDGGFVERWMVYTKDKAQKRIPMNLDLRFQDNRLVERTMTPIRNP